MLQRRGLVIGTDEIEYDLEVDQVAKLVALSDKVETAEIAVSKLV